jgi:hypothetical protein
LETENLKESGKEFSLFHAEMIGRGLLAQILRDCELTRSNLQ